MDGSLPSPSQVFKEMPCLCGLVLVSARAMSRLYNEELRSVGLEVTQLSVLKILEAIGPMPQQALSDRLALDKTTASRNVKVLARHEWVEIVTGEDGRQRIVTLTATGRAKLKQAELPWERAQRRIRQALPHGVFAEYRASLPSLASAAISA